MRFQVTKNVLNKSWSQGIFGMKSVYDISKVYISKLPKRKILFQVIKNLFNKSENSSDIQHPTF